MSTGFEWVQERTIEQLEKVKTWYQREIEGYEQEIADRKRKLAQPSLSSDRKRSLRRGIQGKEILINNNKQQILAIYKELDKRELALRQLDSTPSEPSPPSSNPPPSGYSGATPSEPSPPLSASSNPPPSGDSGDITSEATRKRIFSHPPAKPLTDGGGESQSQSILCRDERIPGVVFVKDQKILEKISSAGKKIDHESDAGISIDIPEGSISPDESVDLLIQPCFSGSFEIPKDMKPASPAYLIETSEQIVLKKPLTMKMQHSVKLQSQEDCKNIVFLRASSDPVYRGSNPVYVFKEVEDVRGTFTIKSQFGEVALTNFSWWRAFIKKGRIKGEISYSARLYRSLSAAADFSAVFCMCPYHAFYTQFCDKSIHGEYSGMSERAEDRTVHNILAITSDAVSLKVQDTTECIMDKPEISKVEIDIPETKFEDPSKIPDYPPRISITCTTTARSLTLSVEGVKNECTFTIIIPPANKAVPPTHSKSTSATLEMIDHIKDLDRNESINLGTEKLHNMVTSSPSSPQQTATQSSLGTVDHFQVSSLLKALNNDEVITLGTALGLDFHNLKRMTSLPDDMVGPWLRGDDNVIKTSGPPSWESLATALDKTGHTKIAITIRREKLHMVTSSPSPPPQTDPPLNPSSPPSQPVPSSRRTKSRCPLL